MRGHLSIRQNRRAAGLFAVQVAFLLVRGLFLTSGSEPGFFCRWRFSAGTGPEIRSLLNVLHFFIVTVLMGNTLHFRLGKDRVEILLRRGMKKSVFRESLQLMCGMLMLEALMTSLAFLLSGLYAEDQPIMDWRCYLPLQLSFWGAEVINVFVMDLLLCIMSSGAAMVVAVLFLSLQMGAAHAKMTFSPLFASTYDLVSVAGSGQGSSAANYMWMIFVEVLVLWIIWLILRSRSDIV